MTSRQRTTFSAMIEILTSRQETDSSAHLDKRSKKKKKKKSRDFRTHSSICKALKHVTVVLENNTTTCFVYCLRRRVCTRARIG